jgi:hypothetical protein
MSDEKIIEETLELVREAQKPGVFNLADVIKDRGYPQKDVSIYIDGEAAFQLVELEDRMQALSESQKSTEDYTKLEEAATALAERLQSSKLTFTMRGVGQGVVERITEKADKLYKKSSDEDEYASEWFRYYVTSLVASNVVRVTDSDGNVDEREFDFDYMLEIRNNIPAEAWGVLVNTMQKLTLATGYFKGLTDAGFLPKS